jgi:hypothetical protein
VRPGQTERVERGGTVGAQTPVAIVFKTLKYYNFELNIIFTDNLLIIMIIFNIIIKTN